MQRNLKFSQTSQLLQEKDNWTCLHLAPCQKWHQTKHDNYESASELSQPPKKINFDNINLATNGDIYLHPEKIIDHLPDSAEGKARWSLHRWVGIETQNGVMHCPTCNITCVCCVTVYLITMFILRRWRTLLKKDINFSKVRKSPNVVLFLVYNSM